MDSSKGKTDSVYFKKIEGRWVPVTASGSIETNSSIQSISTRRRYLSSDGRQITFLFKQLMNKDLYIIIGPNEGETNSPILSKRSMIRKAVSNGT